VIRKNRLFAEKYPFCRPAFNKKHKFSFVLTKIIPGMVLGIEQSFLFDGCF